MTATLARRRRNPRPKGRPTAADAAALPQRLLDAALSVFVRQGYGQATMDAIAREAGVTRKTLYARHAGKADVLAAVVNHLLDAVLQPAATDAAPGAPNKPRARLLQLARNLATLSSTTQVAGLSRLILSTAVQAPELARLFTDMHERAIDRVSAVLTQLHAEGHLGRLRDVRGAATMFIEMAASVARLHAMLGRPLPPKQIEAHAQAAVDLLLAGYGG